MATSNGATFILIPFIIGFVTFSLRFYSRESASSMFNLSFVLAFVCMIVAGCYLTLHIFDMMPVYGTWGFAIVGVMLMAVSIARMFML